MNKGERAFHMETLWQELEKTQKELWAIQPERDRYKAALEEIANNAPKQEPLIRNRGNIDHVEEVSYDAGRYSQAKIARRALKGD